MMGSSPIDGHRSIPFLDLGQEKERDSIKKDTIDSPEPVKKESTSAFAQTSDDATAQEREFYIQEAMRTQGLSRQVAEAQVDSFF